MEKLPNAALVDSDIVRLTATEWDDIIAAQYSGFVSNIGQRDLTVLGVPALMDALSPEDHATFAAATNAWVGEQHGC